MFGWKKKEESQRPEQPTQSQSLSNVNLNGGMVQLGQAGGDSQQNQTGDLKTQQQGLTNSEVVNLLEQLETAIKTSALNAVQQEELLDYLRPAKREAGKETPRKDLVKQNLEQVSETMKTLNETTEAGKSLWQTGTEIFKAVAPWVGVAAAVFGV